MKRSTQKKQITEYVAKEKGYNYKDCYFCIWHNVLPTGGLRLTPQGYLILSTELEFSFWTTKISTDLTLRILHDIEKKINCPYYLLSKTIVVFDERTAVELALFSNNLELYLNL